MYAEHVKIDQDISDVFRIVFTAASQSRTPGKELESRMLQRRWVSPQRRRRQTEGYVR